jgi:hypothetical protein
LEHLVGDFTQVTVAADIVLRIVGGEGAQCDGRISLEYRPEYLESHHSTNKSTPMYDNLFATYVIIPTKQHPTMSQNSVAYVLS